MDVLVAGNRDYLCDVNMTESIGNGKWETEKNTSWKIMKKLTRQQQNLIWKIWKMMRKCQWSDLEKTIMANTLQELGKGEKRCWYAQYWYGMFFQPRSEQYKSCLFAKWIFGSILLLFVCFVLVFWKLMHVQLFVRRYFAWSTCADPRLHAGRCEGKKNGRAARRGKSVRMFAACFIVFRFQASVDFW